MQGKMTLPENSYKIFVFDDVYPLGAATEQANKKRLNAFGLAAKLNPFKRPKEETVLLTKHVKRYEPFWHIFTNRAVDFSREINYPVDIGNIYATNVVVNGSDFPITDKGGKRTINIAAVEHCHRKIDYKDNLDALDRDIKKSVFENALRKYKYQEHESIQLEHAIPLKVSVATLLQKINQTLSSEAINAHEIHQDFITIEKAYLYYRPVFAFEFAWTTEDKIGVIEVDGLTGEVIENGQWLKEAMNTLLTREMLFQASAEIAGVIVPGGGFAVKVVEKITAGH